MTKSTRRAFLRQVVALPAVCVALGSGTVPAGVKEQRQKALEFLVVGDSIAWGQGLEEKDKFYTLIKDWLGPEAFGEPREVNIKISQALPELKKSTGIDYSVRYCEMVAVGHPNPAGARAYAEAIKPAISTFLR